MIEEQVAKIKKMSWLKWPLILSAIFAILLLAFWLTNMTVNQNYQNVILPKVSIGSNLVENLSYEEARDLLQKRVDFISRRGFIYQSDLKNIIVYPNVNSIESTDSSYALVSWDIEKSLDQIFVWQQDKSWKNLFSKLITMWKGKDFVLQYKWDKEQHLNILQNGLKDVLTEKKEASFEILDGELKIIPGQSGQIFDYQTALADTEKQIATLENKEISLLISTGDPELSAKMIKDREAEILAAADRDELHFVFEEETWDVTKDIWNPWLVLKIGPVAPYLGIDEKKLEQYFIDRGISKQIEQPVKDAKFEVSEGKVEEFVSSQPGRALDWEKIISDLESVLNNQNENYLINLSVETIDPKISNDDVNSLGILEIIGTGISDFTGSPRNRVHNISVGAAAVNGTLIAPQEEFSLLATLGEIDGEHGYLQELVIKGNETKPEYGGGLCQIGTTVFRGALSSGLPITERRNHSYRVSYYEPAGTDATIYDPWPDFRFKNDTEKYILIQSRIEGTKIYFDYWGTKDGRQVIMTQPEVYNITPPPEKKIIKTLDLEPGQTKCTERAHNGADAKFDYSVLYPNSEEPIVTTFRSHYVPWQEVCLLGVTQEELDAENTSSTPEEISQ
ncbi:VanW family protein [Candidatus Nomurabacteria bacterium]|nr:VanW family protein [Candidatus Nomurabacteria bacterium]